MRAKLWLLAVSGISISWTCVDLSIRSVANPESPTIVGVDEMREDVGAGDEALGPL